MLNFLKNLLKGKKFAFKLDLDKDGDAFLEGNLDLGELLDEALKYKK